MIKRQSTRHALCFLAFVCLGMAFAPFSLRADTAPPAAPGAAAPVAAPAAPATPAAPAVPATPPADAKNPEENETAPKPNLLSRAAGIIGSLKDPASRIAGLTQQVKDKDTIIAQRDATILALQNQVAGFQSAQKELEDAVNGMTAERKGVIDTVASLGFPAAKLPGAEDEHRAESSDPSSLYAKWKSLKGNEQRAFQKKHETALRAHAATLNTGNN